MAIKRIPYPQKPRTRAECKNAPKPCPWVSCRHNLFLDVEGDKIKTYGADPSKMECWCALDEAENGGMKLEAISDLFNLSRERIRQITEHGLRKMRFQNVAPHKR